MSEAADDSTTLINGPLPVFLIYNKTDGPNLQNTSHMCFLAFSGIFISRFSGNEFIQDCSAHDSVKCNVWEKVDLLSYQSKSLAHGMIFCFMV